MENVGNFTPRNVFIEIIYAKSKLDKARVTFLWRKTATVTPSHPHRGVGRGSRGQITSKMENSDVFTPISTFIDVLHIKFYLWRTDVTFWTNRTRWVNNLHVGIVEVIT